MIVLLIDEIKRSLEKEGYNLDSDTISRIQTMIESIRDDNQINKLDYIIDWFQKKRDESDMIVEEITINELDKWNVDKDTGNIKHQSGGFFEIIGINTTWYGLTEGGNINPESSPCIPTIAPSSLSDIPYVV